LYINGAEIAGTTRHKTTVLQLVQVTASNVRLWLFGWRCSAY